ncbi:MAG: hypothetical protein NTU80_03580 [Verrucomicrobia bacterium]|nr:hypothetical protein [Verrucomicrobiota bacterium]
MKKTAVKSAVKPASPAPKAAAAAKPATKVTAVKVTAVKKVAKIAPAPAAAPVVPAVVAPKATKAVKKPAAPKAKPAVVSASTVIVAAIDVGFGNSLTLRGDGAGLSWEKGVSLEYTADNKWSVSLPATGPVTFKFLINDTTWSIGEDYSVPAGASVELTPAF